MDFFIFFIGLILFIGSFIYLIVSLVKKKFVKKTFFLLLAGGIVLPIVGLSIGMSDTDTSKQTTADEQKESEKEPEATEAEKVEVEEEKPVELTPQEQMIQNILGLIDTNQAFDTGSYIKGDIPVGEYAYIPFEGSGQYYSENDPAGNIIDNENFDSFGYVYVHASGNLQTDGVLINTTAFEKLDVNSAKEIYEVVNNAENFQDSAWYKIGVDLPAGQYILESYSEGYVAVMSGPIGKSDIIDNEIFNGRYTVNVTNGQYLKVSGATITQ